MYDFNDMINRIKTIKKEKQLSNETLSALSGVPKGTLAKILGSETKDPQISNIIKIAEALDVSADYIIFGKNDSINKSEFEYLFLKLNTSGQNKVIEYMHDLHNSGIYSNSSIDLNTLRIASRNGTYIEKQLTDAEIAAREKEISNLPKPPDDL